MDNTLPIQQMMPRKLVSFFGKNIMKIHTSLKSISDREMHVILKSQILTTVEKKKSNLEAWTEDTFFYAWHKARNYTRQCCLQKHKFLGRTITIGPINKIETFDKLEKHFYRITSMYLHIQICICYTQTHTPNTYISYNLVRGYLTILRQRVLMIHSLVLPFTSSLPR